MANRRSPERGPKPSPTPDQKPDSRSDKKTPPEKGNVLELSAEAVGVIKNLLGPDIQIFEATLAELKKNNLDSATLKNFHAQFDALLQQGDHALEKLKKELSAIGMDAELKELVGDIPPSAQVTELEKAITELRKVTTSIDLRRGTKKSEEDQQEAEEEYRREREASKEADKKEREAFTWGLKRSGVLAEDVLQALNEIDRSTVTDFVVQKARGREFSPQAMELISGADHFYKEDLASIQKDREKLRTNFKRSDQLEEWQKILSNPEKVAKLKKMGSYEKALEKVTAQFEAEFEPVRVAAEKEFVAFEEAAVASRNENIVRAVSQELTMDDVGEILQTPDFHLGAVAEKLADVFYNKKDKKDVLSARLSLHIPAEVTQRLLEKFTDRSIERIVELKLGVFYTESFGKELERRGMALPTDSQDDAIRTHLAEKTQFIQQKFIDAKKEAAEINKNVKILQEGKKVAEGEEPPESLQKIQAALERTADITQLEALSQRAENFDFRVQELHAQVGQKFTEVTAVLNGLPPLPQVQAAFLQDSQDYREYFVNLTSPLRQLIDAVADVREKIDAKLALLKESAKEQGTAQREEKIAVMYEVRKHFQTAQYELSSLETDLHSIEHRIHHNKETLAQIAEARAFNLEAEMPLFRDAELRVVSVDQGTEVVFGDKGERRKISEEMSELEKQLKQEIKKLEAQIEPRKQKFENILAPLENGVVVAVRHLELKGVSAQERNIFEENAKALINQFKGDLHKIHSHEKAEVDALYQKLSLMAEIAKGGKDRGLKQEELRKLEVAESEETKRADVSIVVDFQNSTDAQRKVLLAQLESHRHHLEEAMHKLHYTPIPPGTPRRLVMDIIPSQNQDERERVYIEANRSAFEKTFEKLVQSVADEVTAFEALGEETKEKIEKYKQVVKDIEKVQKFNVMVEFPLWGTAVLQEVTLDEGIVSHEKGTKKMKGEILRRMDDLKKDINLELGKDGLAVKFEQERTRMLGKVENLVTKMERTLADMEHEQIKKSEYQKFKNHTQTEINRLREKVRSVEIKAKEAKPAKSHAGHH